MDILQLHHPKDTEKSSVRAFGGLDLNKMFDELCRIYMDKTKTSYKNLAKEIFKVNPNSIQNWRGANPKYKNGHPVPLWAISKILQINALKGKEEHINFVKNIKYLQCGRVSEVTNAQIYLTTELAKLCGAHAADGSLSMLKERGPLSAKWDLGDQEKANIEEAIRWLETSFGFKPVIIQKGKMSYIWSNRQVISRYLTQIFDFPIGNKTETVSMPKILSGNDNRILERGDEEILSNLQLEFAKEVINFDGHSTLSGVVQTGFGSKSKKLLEDVKNVFQREGINFHIYQDKILTTSFNESRKVYEAGLFRGKKREKFEKLILQNARKAEKYP